MEFIRKLFKRDAGTRKASLDDARGAAPVQSQEEQDAARERMEAEMTQQRERRESQKAPQ